MKSRALQSSSPERPEPQQANLTKQRERKSCPYCGQWLQGKRSLPHNGLYHAVLKIAFDNWPGDHGFQPRDERHLRQWLQCKAGHCDIIEHHPGENLDNFIDRIIEAAAIHGHVWSGTQDNGVRFAIIPRSVSFDACEQSEFNAISKAVFGIICDVLGVSEATMKKEIFDMTKRTGK